MATANLIGVYADKQIYHLTLQTLVQAAATTNYNVSVPSGLYNIQMTVVSSVTGTTTTITTAPYLSDAQATAGVGYWTTAAALTSAISIALTAGALSTQLFSQSTTATVPSFNLIVPWGLQVQVAKGTAVTNEAMALNIYLARIG